jgi:hypothetical protein
MAEVPGHDAGGLAFGAAFELHPAGTHVEACVRCRRDGASRSTRRPVTDRRAMMAAGLPWRPSALDDRRLAAVRVDLHDGPVEIDIGLRRARDPEPE